MIVRAFMLSRLFDREVEIFIMIYAVRRWKNYSYPTIYVFLRARKKRLTMRQAFGYIFWKFRDLFELIISVIRRIRLRRIDIMIVWWIYAQLDSKLFTFISQEGNHEACVIEVQLSWYIFMRRKRLYYSCNCICVDEGFDF